MELDENSKVIYEIISIIDKEKETTEDLEYINDFKIINDMIIGNSPYDKAEVDRIKNKYKEEFNDLLNLEIKLRNYSRNYVVYTIKQDLLNVRHSLIRVGINRTLEKMGKEMLKYDLIDNNDKNVYDKFKKILEE